LSTNGSLTVLVVAACPFPLARGTPVRILRLSEALAARGHDVHVVTYPLGEAYDPDTLEIHRTRRVPTYRRTSPGPSVQKLLVLDPLVSRKIQSVLSDREVDVIHAHHYEGLLAALWPARRRQVPVVYDAHTLLASELPTYGFPVPGGLMRRVGRAIDRSLPRRAAHVIAVTDTIRDKLIESGLSADSVTVASDGVEDEFFLPLDPPGGDADPGRTPETVVYAGNLAPYQRVDLLLDAFRSVAARRPAARLRLLTASSFDRFEERARRLGIRDRIDIEAVAVPDLAVALKAATVAVSPRVDCDGIPLKLLNYMAVARPVVAFAGSGPILRHEETGVLVPDNNVAAFADALVGILEDPVRAARIGLAGRRFAEQNHRWSGIAEITEDVFRRVLAQ